ncbi:hypothetical protein ACTQZS_07070 [Bilifractor sp. LCP19S3_H10]|uniref:hypothetical protein n=1 Tax=Bilifractor sp. LCP19S3_H10 TaxID=3438736 RepID=UPI003F8DD329
MAAVFFNKVLAVYRLQSKEKIDGAVAMIMGLNRAIRCGNDSGESIYDDRGILFL